MGRRARPLPPPASAPGRPAAGRRPREEGGGAGSGRASAPGSAPGPGGRAVAGRRGRLSLRCSSAASCWSATHRPPVRRIAWGTPSSAASAIRRPSPAPCPCRRGRRPPGRPGAAPSARASAGTAKPPLRPLAAAAARRPSSTVTPSPARAAAKRTTRRSSRRRSRRRRLGAASRAPGRPGPDAAVATGMGCPICCSPYNRPRVRRRRTRSHGAADLLRQLAARRLKAAMGFLKGWLEGAGHRPPHVRGERPALDRRRGRRRAGDAGLELPRRRRAGAARAVLAVEGGREAVRPRRLRHEGRRWPHAGRRWPTWHGPGTDPELKVKLLIVPDEEAEEDSAQGKSSAFLADEGHLGQFVVCGEPTNLEIGVQSKGVLVCRFDVSGRAAHGSTPWLGDNAILKAIEIYKKVAELPFAEERSELFEHPSINIGRIRGGEVVNSVPDSCRMDVDVRYLPNQDPRTRCCASCVAGRRRGADLRAAAGHPRSRRGARPGAAGDGETLEGGDAPGGRPRRRLGRGVLPSPRHPQHRVRPGRRRHHGPEEFVDIDSLARYRTDPGRVRAAARRPPTAREPPTPRGESPIIPQTCPRPPAGPACRSALPIETQRFGDRAGPGGDPPGDKPITIYDTRGSRSAGGRAGCGSALDAGRAGAGAGRGRRCCRPVGARAARRARPSDQGVVAAQHGLGQVPSASQPAVALVIGSDYRPQTGRTASRSDTLMLVRVDPATK